MVKHVCSTHKPIPTRNFNPLEEEEKKVVNETPKVK
jgi:hypothetical protein